MLGRLLSWGARAARGTGSALLKGFGGSGFGTRMAGQAQWEIADLRQRNLSALEKMASFIGSKADSFVHSIAVKVRGGPAADLRSVYYLACAAVFGRYSRGASRVRGGYFQMSAHIDVTNKEVTVSVGYATSLIGSLMRPTDQKFGSFRTRTPHDVMYEGPDQVTIGANWQMPFAIGASVVESVTSVSGGILVSAPVGTPAGLWPDIRVASASPHPSLQTTPWAITYPMYYTPDPLPVSPLGPVTNTTAQNPYRELPFESTAAQELFLRRHAPVGIVGGQYIIVKRVSSARVPILPDDGRIITTGETNFPAVQPPRPPVDALARGGLVALVAQALTNPGYLPTTPRRYDDNLAASAGVYLRPPGTLAAGTQAAEFVDTADARNPKNAAPPPPPLGLGAAVGGFGLIPTGGRVAPNVTE